MKRMLLAFAALALHAQTADEMLQRGRARILEAIDRMPRYTCTQTIDRNYFEPRSATSSRLACDTVVALRDPASLKWVGSDRFRFDVMVAQEGMEVFSWPGGRSLSMERVEALAGEGPIGTGGFGPFLINIFATPGVEFISEGAESAEGRLTWRFRYRVPLPASHYEVIVNGTKRIVPYDGRFWLDAQSAELLQLTVRTMELAPATGNCEATTTVDFSRVRVGTGEYLLPSKNVLRIVRRDRSEAENQTIYAACHEFHGESLIHFEGDLEASQKETAEKREPAYPAGVALALAFSAPIDTATASAGDVVEAQLTRAVAPKRRDQRAVPTGTRVRGRITSLRRRAGDFPYIAITLAWESMERGSKWVPFAAHLDEPVRTLEQQQLYRRSRDSWLTTSRRAPPGDTLVFETSDPKYVIRPGRETYWISITP